MYTTLQLIDTAGAVQNIPVVCNAATSIRYHQVFKKELMTAMTDLIQSLDVETLRSLAMSTGSDGSVDLSSLTKEEMAGLAGLLNSPSLRGLMEGTYVMARQAEGGDAIRRLSYDDYLDWLGHWEIMGFLSNSEKILTLYTGGQMTTVEAKKG